MSIISYNEFLRGRPKCKDLNEITQVKIIHVLVNGRVEKMQRLGWGERDRERPKHLQGSNNVGHIYAYDDL